VNKTLAIAAWMITLVSLALPTPIVAQPEGVGQQVQAVVTALREHDQPAVAHWGNALQDVLAANDPQQFVPAPDTEPPEGDDRFLQPRDPQVRDVERAREVVRRFLLSDANNPRSVNRVEASLLLSVAEAHPVARVRHQTAIEAVPNMYLQYNNDRVVSFARVSQAIEDVAFDDETLAASTGRPVERLDPDVRLQAVRQWVMIPANRPRIDTERAVQQILERAEDAERRLLEALDVEELDEAVLPMDEDQLRQAIFRIRGPETD
jgi:hypothetical protein